MHAARCAPLPAATAQTSPPSVADNYLKHSRSTSPLSDRAPLAQTEQLLAFATEQASLLQRSLPLVQAGCTSDAGADGAAAGRQLVLPLDQAPGGDLTSCMSSARGIATEIQLFTERLTNLQQQQQQQQQQRSKGGEESGPSATAAAAAAAATTAAAAGGRGAAEAEAAAVAAADPLPPLSLKASPDASARSTPLPTALSPGRPPSEVTVSPSTPRRASQGQQQSSGVVPATPDPATAGPPSLGQPARQGLRRRGCDAAAAAAASPSSRCGDATTAVSHPPPAARAAAAAAAAAKAGGGKHSPAPQPGGPAPALAAELAALREHKAWSERRLAELLGRLCAREQPLGREIKVGRGGSIPARAA
jgi:hypothetical protein